MRWIGIDEAGYGPNLGPLVMTAVVAEGPGDRPPDVWDDLPATIARAGGEPARLWVDDSKRLLRGGTGLDRLERAALAAVAAATGVAPDALAEFLAAVGAGTPEDVELSPWLDGIDPPPWPRAAIVAGPAAPSPFAGAPWRLAAVRSVLIGPGRFNAELAARGSKAAVHFGAFARLLAWAWDRAADGVPTAIRADKHGGRHFYLDLLGSAVPDARIDRGPEGPALSRYTLRRDPRRLELALAPRADAEDGLVALASIVSKALREWWMAVFNAWWCARVPGLRPSAGYPVNAARFRAAIEPEGRARGLDPERWWRAK